MDNQGQASTYLESILVLHQNLAPGANWTIFWKAFFEHQLPPPEPNKDKFISIHCKLLSGSLGTLGKGHPLVKKFLSELPLRYSKTTFDWPPTPEQIKELMTD